MTNKTVVIGLVAVLLIAMGGYMFPSVNERVIERVKDGVGSIAGPDVLYPATFHESFTTRGHFSTTTVAAFTMTTAHVDRDLSYLEMNVDEATTATTMASTSAPFSGLAAGEGFSMDVYNSGDSVLTFAAGTGVDIQEDTSGALTVASGEMARLYFRKKTNTDVLMWVHVGQVGD